MRKIIWLVFLSFYTSVVHPQDKSFCPTYVYKGYILENNGRKIEINLNFLVLLDSTIVGSYYYKAQNGSLSLSGKLYPDNSLEIVERTKEDKITGYFKGKIAPNKESFNGRWVSPKNEKTYDFTLNQMHNGSYWDYIKKFRSLPEFHNIDSAMANTNKVLSVDLSDKEIKGITDNWCELKNVISVNLLANHIHVFPKVLTTLPKVEEISLSSNEMKYVGPEIGKLKSLRVLYINFNLLNKLPNEIGELSNLLCLDISSNNIKSLPREIVNLRQLQELHAENNHLSKGEMEKIKKSLPNCVVYF